MKTHIFQEKIGSNKSVTSVTSATSSKSFSESKTTYHRSSYNFEREPIIPGVVGLNNIGNTCFMDSMLQCISNCQPLTEYFLSGEYEKDINVTNPIGTHGELAKAYLI